MEVTTSIREEDGKTQVTVTVPASKVKEHVDAQFKEMGKARIPGFRPGRAPRKILEQNFGGHEAVFQEITTNLINDVAPLAADSQDIIFISNPEFENAQTVVEGEEFTFTMFAKVKPEVELLTYDPVEIKLPSETATDEEIDGQIESLRGYYYTFESAGDRAVEEGDYVSIDVKCVNDGEEVQGLCGEDRLVELGAGSMPAAFEAELVGMKAGESKSFEFTIAGDENWSYLKADMVQAEVTLKEIKVKVLPELDDDFAKKIGSETIADLRKMIGDAVSGQKKQAIPGLKESRCLEELSKRIYGDIPQSYINYTKNETLREFFNNLQRNETTFDAFLEQQGITTEEFQADLDQEAKLTAGENLALDALCKHLEIEATEEDLDKEFSVVDNPEEVRKSWEDAGRMAEIREGVRRRKASEWLLENAIVTEDDGTDEDEEADEA